MDGGFCWVVVGGAGGGGLKPLPWLPEAGFQTGLTEENPLMSFDCCIVGLWVKTGDSSIIDSAHPIMGPFWAGTLLRLMGGIMGGRGMYPP